MAIKINFCCSNFYRPWVLHSRLKIHEWVNFNRPLGFKLINFLVVAEWLEWRSTDLDTVDPNPAMWRTFSFLSYFPPSQTPLILISLISKSVRRDLSVDDDDDEAARADADARPEPTPMRCRKMLFPTQLQNRESRRRSCFDSTTLAIFLNQCQRHLAECPLSSLLPLINHWVPQKVTCTINELLNRIFIVYLCLCNILNKTNIVRARIVILCVCVVHVYETSSAS